MTDIHLPKYDSTRDNIKKMKKNGDNWNVIEERYDALKSINILDDYINKEVWKQLVREVEGEYEHSKHIKKSRKDTSIISDGEDNEAFVPKSERSSWQLYRHKLLNNGWRKEAVDNLEKSTVTILKKLNRDTIKSGPKKGLVIGHVQSGKTASMAGLIAMSADWGWNTFIVLSGMIENLREQTQQRLISDLSSPGNNNWRSLNKLSRHSEPGDRTQNLDFTESSSQKFINVCLKNKTRLESLIGWLNQDTKKLEQIKMLVIDDEADQGSVNTKKLDKDERAKINQLIIDLVEIGGHENSRPKSMSYISYTATPYSNFLNESSPKSLYPKDFIGLLPISKDYFGPKQIFGGEDSLESERLDITRRINEEDVLTVKEIHEGETDSLPRTLIDSISWFFCASSVMRFLNIKKPLSMLVHTSQLQAHHDNISNAISTWIRSVSTEDLLNICKANYESEINRFSLTKFREAFTEYPTPNEEINNYPHFNEIQEYITELKSKISHIEMDKQGDLDYHKGIHICIDNSAKNGINDEDEHIRLAYPTKEKLEKIDRAPVFIIIGGSTLSRGLTIEGLVSTYFLRAATAGDSLMQMGRWFGYRRGYELLPRIWMTENTFEQFQFLTTLEEELREELAQFAIDNKSPSEYGPRVKNTPKVSWLRVTAKNKMQNSEEIEMDFTGASIQTIHFDNDKEILSNNINTTERFLLNYCNEPIKSIMSSSIYYKDVKFKDIKNEFLLKMIFNNRSKTFNQIESFCQWYEKVQGEIGFENWNVIVAGAGKVINDKPIDNKKQWYLKPFSVGKVNRSAKYSSMNYNKDIANIGVLRGPSDLLADIDDESILEGNDKPTNDFINDIREKYNMGNIPQLIIYRIKKDSIARVDPLKENQNRLDLNFDDDIIGVYINIPGDSSKPHAKGLTVRIDNNVSIE